MQWETMVLIGAVYDDDRDVNFNNIVNDTGNDSDVENLIDGYRQLNRWILNNEHLIDGY